MSDEINLADYLKVILRRKDAVVFVVSLCLLFTALFCIITPPSYRASTTMLIPSKPGGLSNFSSIIASMPISVPLDLQTGAYQRATNFKDILESETLAEMVAGGLGLEREFPDIKTRGALVSFVRKTLRVKENKGVITVNVETKRPRLSRDIANYYVLALDRFNRMSNVQIAQRTSAFIKEQLSEARADLSLAEERLQKFRIESTRVKVSESELILGRLERDVRIKEALYTLLLSELEKSKIEEARAVQFFEVLDPAKLPRAPSKPRVLLSLAGSLVIGLFLGVFTAFFFEYLEASGIRTPNLRVKFWKRPNA